MFAGVYSGRRVLVTGHTGFKGSWLCAWLLKLDAKVAGFSLGEPTIPANFGVLRLQERLAHFQGDVREAAALEEVIKLWQPEIVFHLAAQSLVRRSYGQPVETFTTNALGTLQVLECLRQAAGVRVGVIITSDKCYQNQEWTWGYRENDRLGGEDPYSASKACAELICQAYQHSYFQTATGPWVATTRAGNVIGGGDWAPDRIVPDCIRAWAAGQPVRVRQSQATRPWQHVLEPLSGYLWLGARLWHRDPGLRGESFNFGPSALINESVAELIANLVSYWPGATWEVDTSGQAGQKESTLLKLCCDKVLNHLGWRAILSFAETIRLTAEWYRTYYEMGPEPIYALTFRQIEEYQERARRLSIRWAVT